MNLTNYNKLNVKNKIITKIIVFSLAIIFAGYFGILPNINSIKDLRVQIINTKISIHENIEKEKNIDTLKKDLEKIEPEIDKLNNVFINKNQELEFITALEQIANENGVKQTLNLNNFPEDSSGFSTISLEINCSGTFNNLMNYIMNIESSKYYLNISYLSLTSGKTAGQPNLAPDSTQTGDSILSLNIKADTFFK